MEQAKKRTVRSKEERIQEIEQKIAKRKEEIKQLEAKMEAILHPKKRKTEAALTKEILAKAKKSGLTIKEIAQKLGVELE